MICRLQLSSRNIGMYNITTKIDFFNRYRSQKLNSPKKVVFYCEERKRFGVLYDNKIDVARGT